MPKLLQPDEVLKYRDEGYVSPVQAFSPEVARRYRDQLEAVEQRYNGTLSHDLRRKMYLYLRWVDDIVRNNRILDAVEDIIGPDILVYHLTLWTKEPHTDAFISWHQDSTYFGLDPAEHVTAWVALSDSNLENGCVQIIPGSHKLGQQPHHVVKDGGNMLRDGQQLLVGDNANIEIMQLSPGQFSLHHTHLYHNSTANHSADRRIGLGISYIPTCCRCTSSQRLTASLVRGVDHYGHFDLDPAPLTDFDPLAVKTHEAAMARWHVARKELIAEAHALAA